MKTALYRLVRWIKKQLWAMIVAYMLAMHNFYTGEDKTSDDIVITIEHIEVNEDDAPDQKIGNERSKRSN